MVGRQAAEGAKPCTARRGGAEEIASGLSASDQKAEPGPRRGGMQAVRDREGVPARAGRQAAGREKDDCYDRRWQLRRAEGGGGGIAGGAGGAGGAEAGGDGGGLSRTRGRREDDIRRRGGRIHRHDGRGVGGAIRIEGRPAVMRAGCGEGLGPGGGEARLQAAAVLPFNEEGPRGDRAGGSELGGDKGGGGSGGERDRARGRLLRRVPREGPARRKKKHSLLGRLQGG